MQTSIYCGKASNGFCSASSPTRFRSSLLPGTALTMQISGSSSSRCTDILAHHLPAYRIWPFSRMWKQKRNATGFLEARPQLPAGSRDVVAAFGTHAVADAVRIQDVSEGADGLTRRRPIVGSRYV